MSDYFRALAVRALQPELGVQPRRRAPFEDSSSGGGRLTIIQQEGIGHAAPPNAAEGEPRPPARSGRRRRDAADEPMDQPLVRHRASGQRVSSRGVGDDTERVAAPHPTVRVAERAPVVPTARPETGSAPPLQRRDATTGPGRATAPLVGRATAGSLPVTIRGVPRIRETAAPSEPTVRIHIGRVDVRAVTEVAPSRQAPRERQSALMTLDEYVRQRDGGRS